MIVRFCTLFILSFFSYGVFAQVGQLQFTLIDSLALGIPGETIFAYGELNNGTDTDVEMLLIKQVNDMPEGWSSAICTDVCAAPTVDTAFLLLRSQDSQSFIMYYYTGDEPASGYTYMEFLNLDDISNVYYQGFTGQTSAITSIHETERPEYLKIGPNPFDKEVIFHLMPQPREIYGNMKLEIFNSSGILIFEQALNGNEKVLFTNEQRQKGQLIFVLTGDRRILQSGKLIAK